MTPSHHRQQDVFGFGLSILVHACVFLLGIRLLFQPPVLDLTPGQSAHRIALSMISAPEPEVAPPVPAIPVPQPDLPLPPAPAAPPLPAALPVLRETVMIPPAPRASTPSRARPAHAPAHATASHQAPSDPSSGATIEAQPFSNPAPDYPEESQMNHEVGTVLLRIEVTAAGMPGKVSISRSSGFLRLDRAAVEAVKQWKFHPALIAGIPVPAAATVPVQFHLTNK